MNQLEAGKNVILEIEVQGALAVKAKNPEAVLIFITPPSAEELKRRLIGRGTETLDVVEMRMRRAAEEAEGLASYDYILINDELQVCVEQMHNIIQSEHFRTSRNHEFMTKIKDELSEGLKGE